MTLGLCSGFFMVRIDNYAIIGADKKCNCLITKQVKRHNELPDLETQSTIKKRNK